jgi:deoxyribonuclease V
VEIGGGPSGGVFAAVDVHYPSSGGARAAVVVAADAAFSVVLAESTAVVPEVMAYRPGEFFRRELPPLRAVLRGGVPVIGVAKSAFRTAIHAVPILRGTSARPLFVTAAGMPRDDAADLIRHMAGSFRLPDALRLVDALARKGRPAGSQASHRPG